VDVAISRVKRDSFTVDDLRRLEANGTPRETLKSWGWVCPACKVELTLAFGDQLVYFKTDDTRPHEPGCPYEPIIESGGGTQKRFDPRELVRVAAIDLSAFTPSPGAAEPAPATAPGDTAATSPGTRPNSRRGQTRYTRNGMPETLEQFASLLVQLDREGISHGTRKVKGLYGKAELGLDEVVVTPGARLATITAMPRVQDKQDVFVFGTVVDVWVDERLGEKSLSVRLRPSGGRQTLSSVFVKIPTQYQGLIKPDRSLLVRGRRSGEPKQSIWFSTRFPANVAVGRLQAMDGHLLCSEDEVMIDDYLTCRGITHTVPSRHEDTWSLDACRMRFNGWLPDWILDLPNGQKVIVEYFGFAQTGEFGRRYAGRKAEKLKFYPTLDPEFLFIALEQVQGARPDARRRQLHAMLDRELATVLR